MSNLLVLFTCPICNRAKPLSQFVSSDKVRLDSEPARICKDCYAVLLQADTAPPRQRLNETTGAISNVSNPNTVVLG